MLKCDNCKNKFIEVKDCFGTKFCFKCYARQLEKENAELKKQFAEKVKEIKVLNQETIAFGIFELNGRLTDCIIEVTENIDDNNILKLFETLSQKFYEANLAEMKKLNEQI